MGGCSDAKVTTMILSVDLDCCPCYIKVKKLLCKFPQIRDQVFDEKQNTITITVVCCSPDKIKDKLCQKAGKSIKAISIKDSNPKSKGGDDEKKGKPKGGDEQVKDKKDKPKGVEDEKPKSKSGDDNKEKEKDKVKDKEKEKEKGSSGEKSNKEKDKDKKKEQKEGAAAPAAAAAQAWMSEPEAQWVPAYPLGHPPPLYPISVYYGGPSNCYDGVPVAPPCYHNQQSYGYSYGRPPCPPGYYPNRSDYLSDENPAACAIM